MTKIFIDTLIYNFTPFKSFFFLTNVNQKSLIYNLSIGLFIDLFIIHSMLLNTIFMVLAYLIHKYLKLNYFNFINYYLFNILLVFVYYLTFSLIYNFKNIFFEIFIINSIFIIISYIKDSKDINLYRWYNWKII